MAEKVEGNGTSAASLSRFVSERVAPLAKAFAQTPLMELRLRTPEGTIHLVKAAGEVLPVPVRQVPRAATRTGPRQHLMPTTDAGHPYDMINADVVGIFVAAPDMPAPGGRIVDDQLLGYIEALKLKHPVRSGGAGILVSQIVEDGAAVDFGEPLFVVDRSEAAKSAAPASDARDGASAAETTPVATPELLEPPRL